MSLAEHCRAFPQGTQTHSDAAAILKLLEELYPKVCAEVIIANTEKAAGVVRACVLSLSRLPNPRFLGHHISCTPLLFLLLPARAQPRAAEEP